MTRKEEFLKRILATYRIEAEESINSMSAYLIKLEKESDDSLKKELIEVIYRSAHSLKGASRAVNLNEIESLCHAFEGVMSVARENNLTFTSTVFDILHKTVNLISELLDVKDNDISIGLNDSISDQIDILSRLENGEEIDKFNDKRCLTSQSEKSIGGGETTSCINEMIPIDNRLIISEQEQIVRPNKITQRINSFNETIRVSNKKLNKLLFQAEEMLSIKLSSIESRDNLRLILEKLSIWEKELEEYLPILKNVKKSFDGEKEKLIVFDKENDIVKLGQFYEWTNSYIKEIEGDINVLLKKINQEAHATGSMIEYLLDDVKDLITVPFSALLDIFPKMVRDVAKDLGKEVDFVIEGEDIEIDRRVLEKIKDPLIHILRNSIDYGIEKTTARIKRGKSFKGKIILRIERLDNNKVEISISDDGGGLDIERIRNLYIKNENIDEGCIDNITDNDCIDYVFQSGISTSDIVTDISGRGMGLAIVQENIDQLGGTIVVETKREEYTIFRLCLPLSLVTFRGVLLQVHSSKFVVPTSKVERVIRLAKTEIKTIENKNTFSYNGEIITLLNLSDILSLSGKMSETEYANVIILNDKGKQIGFVVDRFVGEQEVLVKKFNKQLSRVKYISGATILGSGKVVPIINISDLFKSALKNNTSVFKFEGEGKSERDEQKSILIVEDSVTSRMLLKNILESSGYRVVTAIDGIDGYTKLKEGSFDAVVSDIEMPRLNGFELTEKIRKDNENKEIPIVLVTSLSKREDREKGIDVGANAYIIKSSFDHSNLLEILDRLM